MTPWFVVNPRAGRVRPYELTRTIRRELRGREATIACDPPSNASQSTLVVAVGGDGTINRVINQCDPGQLRLGIIPRGSANDLGAELGIPADFRGAWEVLESGNYERIDLISVNGSRFATCGGIGLASEVAARANRWKARPGWIGRATRRLGPLVYLLATLREVQRSASHPIEATIRTGGVRRRVRLSTALVSNQARVGGFFSASPGASNRDGELHFCGVRAVPGRVRLLRLCAQLLRGGGPRCSEIFELRARSLTIETRTDVTFFGDGEALARGRLFQIEVLRGALLVASGRPQAAWAEAA